MTEPERSLAVEIAELRQSIERLTAMTSTLQESIDAARARVDEVAETAAPLETVNRDRAAVKRRTWIAVAFAFVFVVALSALGAVALQNRSTGRHFAKVQQGLLEGCQARQESDAALRVKNRQLRDDTLALAKAIAESPAAGQLAPILTYLRNEAIAYDDYLKAIPPTSNCQERYGR